jgi:hypothetical protein
MGKEILRGFEREEASDAAERNDIFEAKADKAH